MLLFLPTISLAAQVVLAWDNPNPTVDGFQVFQRIEGAAYDYNSPAWPTDGQDHTETTCTIQGLAEGTTYYFVVRSYLGSYQSVDSNEVSHQVPISQQISYTITATSGNGGTISPAGQITVNEGDSQTFQFTPNSGYIVADVLVDGQSVGAVQSYTFSNVTKDCTIAVSFSQLSYTIDASAGSNGAIEPSGVTFVAYGGSKTFDFTPSAGYQVADVLVDGNSIGVKATYTFTNVTENHSISVSFAAKPVQNQAPVAEAGEVQITTAGSTVTLDGSGSYDPDGDPLAYQWRQTSGTDVGLECAKAQCSFTAPDVTGEANLLTLAFELTVTDGQNLFDSDTCLVQVNAVQQQPDNDGDGTPDDQDTDDDNDGMPDSWETQYGFNPFSSSDADLDADDDGATNLEEYLAGTNPLLGDNGNQKPNRPAITSPGDGDTNVNLTPTITASEFDDPDPGDLHSKTQWLIIATDNQQVVLDRTCSRKRKCRFRVPRLVLNPLTQYTVQVRFFDDGDLASDWSAPVTFTTASDNKDVNKNKIPDDQEVSALTDMNGDSIADIDQQDTIKSLSTYDSQYFVGISIEESQNANAVESATSIDPITLEEDTGAVQTTSYGLLGSKITVSESGSSATTTIYLSDPIDEEKVSWKRYDNSDGWQNSSASSVDVEAGGFVVKRTITDGGTEDADGTANGIIVDLSGPLAASASGDDSSLLSSSDGAAASGGSGGGGCFIQTLFGGRNR